MTPIEGYSREVHIQMVVDINSMGEVLLCMEINVGKTLRC
jgi:hypothetical protein